MQPLPGNLAIENNPSELELWNKLENLLADEKGILGYRLPSLGVPSKEDIPSFILRSKKFGIVLLDIVNSRIESIDENGEFWHTSDGKETYSRDIITSQFYEQIINRLSKNRQLYDFKRRKLTFPDIRAYIIFPYNTRNEIDSIWEQLDTVPLINEFISKEEIDSKLKKEVFIDSSELYIEDSILDIIDSLFENTDRGNQKLKPISQPRTINDFIQKSLDYTFKLDEIQRKIAMQVPDGPQRIRGLAGTGKTVILSMKAALVHKDFPNYKVLFIFNTQSMYNQIKKNISTYYIKETQQNPNWNTLEVLHAWGGNEREGLYSKIARQYGIRPKTYYEVKQDRDPLEKIYADLLKEIKGKLEPIYDVVLIDEAQDFSPALFETVYFLTKTTKRIIWAYDEFQTLKELKIKESDKLFGKDKDGNPNLPESSLQEVYEGGIEKDFVLPNSYRNPRITLMLAHGVGMGLYKRDEIIPIEDRASWVARGYKVIKPEEKTIFEDGDEIIVERSEENSKNILENLLRDSKKNEKELVTFNTFENSKDELDEIVERISGLVNLEQVSPEEIIVINLDTSKSEREFEYLRQELDKREIKAITPGYIEKRDQFKEPGFITLTTPFRAKGNEANVVFILNVQSVVDNPTYRMRNSFFVAVTRSRGWCYISGHGFKSNILRQEVQSILSDYPRFKFTFPKAEDLQRRLELLSADKDLEKVDRNIDRILKDDTYKALLLEKLKRDEQLSDEVRRLFQDEN